jgi:predicted RNase H-like HicB family nuclease
MYRIGYPLWRTLGKAGIPLTLRVNVLHDAEANVFVASSDDLRGLVCEANTFDELVKDVKICIDELLELQLNNRKIHRPVTDLRLSGA